MKKNFNFVVCCLGVCFLFGVFFSGVLVVGVVFECSHFSFWLVAVLELFSYMECSLLVDFCLVDVPTIFWLNKLFLGVPILGF